MKQAELENVVGEEVLVTTRSYHAIARLQSRRKPGWWNIVWRNGSRTGQHDIVRSRTIRCRLSLDEHRRQEAEYHAESRRIAEAEYRRRCRIAEAEYRRRWPMDWARIERRKRLSLKANWIEEKANWIEEGF